MERIARAMAMLAGGGGIASLVGPCAFGLAALEPDVALVAAAPWLAAAVAILVGALAVCGQRAGAGADEDPSRFVGPAVASLALVPAMAGIGTWLIVAGGVPLCAAWMADAGGGEAAPASVVQPLPGATPGCRHRVVLTAVPLRHPVIACVDATTWSRARPGAGATIRVVRGPTGMAILGVALTDDESRR